MDKVIDAIDCLDIFGIRLHLCIHRLPHRCFANDVQCAKTDEGSNIVNETTKNLEKIEISEKVTLILLGKQMQFVDQDPCLIIENVKEVLQYLIVECGSQ